MSTTSNSAIADKKSPDYILTIICTDKVGIVANVSGFLAAHDGFILDSQQHADLETGKFFMRVRFRGASDKFPDLNILRDSFTPIAHHFDFHWTLDSASQKPRIIIAVSRGSHCLNDLLHRWRTGSLPVEIAAVISNHNSLEHMAQWYDVPFHHLPVASDLDRPAQEAAILKLMEDADYLVLARYMQILSNDMAEALSGRCINIHHSFLPSFKGARPYHSAHARGVKLIGATAHFVNANLDEGPIIEQAVERVDHSASVNDLIRIGRDIEAQVLARAVSWVAEKRVFSNGNKTLVFR